jgi:predicted DNA-binding transcriptional regulator AlpA
MSNGQKLMKKPIKTKGFRAMSIEVSTGHSLERHLRMSDAAKVLGISRSTLYRLLPRIRHCRIPASGLDREIIVFAESSLTEFLARYAHIPEAHDAA